MHMTAHTPAAATALDHALSLDASDEGLAPFDTQHYCPTGLLGTFTRCV